MRWRIAPGALQRLLVHKQPRSERFGDKLVGEFDPVVQINRPANGLKAVGRGVAIRNAVSRGDFPAVRQQQKVAQVVRLRQHGQMIVLHHRGAEGGQTALLEVGKHEEEPDGREEFQHRVAEVFKPFIVFDRRRGLVLDAQLSHGVHQSFEAGFGHEAAAGLAVRGLAVAEVGLGIANVVGIGAAGGAVRRVGQGELEEIAIPEGVADFGLENVEGNVETVMECNPGYEQSKLREMKGKKKQKSMKARNFAIVD